MFERVGTYFYVLPTYTQSKKVIWDGIDKDGFRFLNHIPPEIIKGKPNETEMRIDLVNGSAIQLIGAENIDRIVGTNPVGVVFSEYSLMKPTVWDFIRPILAENGGWAVFIFTPRGQNHAYKLLQQANESPEWFSQVLTVKDTGAISPEVVEQERKEMPQALFEQEYYCKFIEGASQVFRNHRNCTYPAGTSLYDFGDFKLGVDLAKYQDWTVITPFNLNTFTAYPQDRFNQVDWITQEGRIEALYRRYGNARVTIDATGIGDPIVDHLSEKGVEVEPFKFTADSRDRLLRNLAILLEQGKIRIPDDEGLLQELDYFQYEMGPTGKIRMAVPEGLHDDRVMSLALAVWGVMEPQVYIPAFEERANYDRPMANPI